MMEDVDAFAREVEATDPAFAQAYDRLSRVGACDCWGGMESRRVYREWCEAGRPEDIKGFIRLRANVGPSGV